MSEKKRQKILVAISGGVDSAVTMLLMKNAGFDVTSATLLLCEYGISEAESAKKLSESLCVPHILLERRELFKNEIMIPFARSYADGLTPNPCVDCNKKIKFGVLCEYAEKEGFDLVATGHYALAEYSEKYGRRVIKRAEDPKKDQSYVLWQLTRAQIEKAYFPLGTYTKDEVRSVAEANGFANARKKDSQDICFITDTDYADFAEELLGKKFPSGNFVDTRGKILGRHKGIIRYTVGQRKGLGLSLPAPLYVKEKNLEKNQVVLSEEKELFTDTAYAKNVNFQAIDGITSPIRAFVKVRYSAKLAEALISFDGEKLVFNFDEAQRAITPGQSAVVYDKDGVILCGGTII